MQTRRAFLKYASAGSAGLCLTVPGLLRADPPAKPNIIYLLADDLGYGDLGCYGQRRFSTPNIDRLAAEGMRFTQHYSGSTVCAPARCSLMTGLHTGHCRIRGNKGTPPEGQWPLQKGTLTVASMLQKAGYATGAFGKWGLGGPASEGDPNHQGFDCFYGYKCQTLAHRYYQKYLWHNREKVDLPQNNPVEQTGDYCQDLIVDQMLDFVRRNHDRPFFLYVPFLIPHAELAVPADSLDKYKDRFPEVRPHVNTTGSGYGTQTRPRAAFAAMVDRIDGYVGRLLDLLKQLNLDDNTIVIFSSDNGPHREGGADPDFFNSGGPFKGYKRDLYEGGIRVPMLVRWPGQVAPGAVTDHISAFWDILPTCAEIAGIPQPGGLDGISFLPTLLARPQKQHEYLYWEFHERGGRQALRMQNWKAVRHDAMTAAPGPLELYDLSNDPGEQTNRASDRPDVAARLEKLIAGARIPNPVFPFFIHEQQRKEET